MTKTTIILATHLCQQLPLNTRSTCKGTRGADSCRTGRLEKGCSAIKATTGQGLPSGQRGRLTVAAWGATINILCLTPPTDGLRMTSQSLSSDSPPSSAPPHATPSYPPHCHCRICCRCHCGCQTGTPHHIPHLPPPPPVLLLSAIMLSIVASTASQETPAQNPSGSLDMHDPGSARRMPIARSAVSSPDDGPVQTIVSLGGVIIVGSHRGILREPITPPCRAVKCG
jgi:hypothetical protein